MFWLIRKVVNLVVLSALVFLLLHMSFRGKTGKEYVVSFYRSPLFQEAWKGARHTLMEFISKPETSESPEMDPLPDADRRELEKILEKEGRK